MRRRDLVKGIVVSAATWPVVAVAQQSAIPVIGFLSFRSANESADSEAGFRQGLSEIGYSDGRNVHIAFRWAEGQKDRLPVLASDLVNNLHVAVIAATGGAFSALAAKAATNHSDRIHLRQRPRKSRHRGQLEPTRRKHHWRDVVRC
jgi:ABC-type uncharacterized transport system substrate-binding protein